MGSPSVFHTAPPQLASKARITCSPQLAGGPDASQNGFGQRMPPAKTVERSAMLRLQPIRDSDSRAFSFGNRVHNFAAAVDAIAAGEVAVIAGGAGLGIHDDVPVRQFDVAHAAKKIEESRLAGGENQHVARDEEIRAFEDLRPPS